MKKQDQALKAASLLTDHDIYLFKEGTHFRLYNKLGAHLGQLNGVKGTFFAVWAPNAARVSLVGDFNEWDPAAHPMTLREDESGIWETFAPGLGQGTIYKYHIDSSYHNYSVNKGDPFAFFWELPPNTASVVWDLKYDWDDAAWMKKRHEHNALDAPYSVYEVHLGSWQRDPSEPGRLLSYREVAPMLADYVKKMGFTHVEFLPLMEHPFYPSWGYQTGGYFAPTRRYGCCQDLMYLIDHLHQNDIGVILDWVPSHFPTDEYGLGYFDGTHLYEHADPRLGFHPDWKSAIYNYGRNEARAYLISSAMFWLEKYHVDVLRVDAVASMLYLDYSREEGEWIPNEKGGRENLDAIAFLRRFNEMVYRDFPDTQTVAEESTSWPMVTRPVETGGLGFGMKWNMGWMHDTLEYFSMDPIYRKYHQDKLTFSVWYAFSENFTLPLSHDEVVHGKGSLYGKMPGDPWQKLANLRLLYGYMFTHPGKKLLFMGAEFGQHREWRFKHSLDWHLLEDPGHQGLQRWVRDLNHFYRTEPALYELDFEQDGFSWIDFHDADNSVVSYLRRDSSGRRVLAVICNFTPVPRHDYRIGVAHGGFWEEILNSDATEYGGSGQGNMGGIEASSASFYGNFDYTLSVTIPPLGLVVFRKDLSDHGKGDASEE
ncbi:MAG: 1,4-alpha-glucan branching protein GlgB [Phycisphaerales bacterium]|nr:MAG: 1,4-alpha-glucan branching protein GlgB [Phycisphaerales bacterium]